ncbi:MAG: thiamine-phosphate kinase [Candidatus Brocadiia bacterium]
MAERELIEHVCRLLEDELPGWVDVGPGDDAAVVEAPGGCAILLTTDMVVEGVHFEPGTELELVGRKAVGRGLSDLAAMAARPLCMVAAVHLGSHSHEDGRQLMEAILSASQEFGAPVVGGDIAAGGEGLSVTVTAVGTPGPAGAIRRAGARPGDAICVTGLLGGSLKGRHLRFEPRIPQAIALADGFDVHALIDVSDGLSTDVLHLAEAGGVGVLLRAADLPVSRDAVLAAEISGHEPFWHALNDGEDYELLFCLPAAQVGRVVADGLEGIAVTRVGEVTDGPTSVLLLPDGSRTQLLPGGWEHELA